MVSKNWSVCLSFRPSVTNFDPNYLRTGTTDEAEIFYNIYSTLDHIILGFILVLFLQSSIFWSNNSPTHRKWTFLLDWNFSEQLWRQRKKAQPLLTCSTVRKREKWKENTIVETTSMEKSYVSKILFVRKMAGRAGAKGWNSNILQQYLSCLAWDLAEI